MFYNIQSIKNWDLTVFNSLLCSILSKNNLFAKQSAHLNIPLIYAFLISVFFYTLNNKICFYHYFLSLSSFEKPNFLELQSAHVDFCVINLFTTCCGMIDILYVLFLHFKQQYVFFFFNVHFERSLRFFVINFTNHFYNNSSIFLTIYFKHFDFIVLCFSNFNSSNLFGRSSINDFLVDFSVCFLIDSAM